MMKKIVFIFFTLALMALTISCSKDDQPFKSQKVCEIGNTGKVVSSVSYSTYSDDSPYTFASNMTLRYSPDCSKITEYDLSEGIPGKLMKDYSYNLHGDTVIDNKGKVLFNDLKFNDKGYICHLTDFQGFSHGTTHVTYDISYNNEDRMSKITFHFLDADEKTNRIQNVNLFWENGLLKSVEFDNNGEVKTTTYEYGDKLNIHHQASVSFFSSLNLLSLDIMRPFLAAGYFGKGPDKFEVSSLETSSSAAESRTYSVELDAEGKINALHEEYGKGSHVDYTFTYYNIK